MQHSALCYWFKLFLLVFPSLISDLHDFLGVGNEQTLIVQADSIIQYPLFPPATALAVNPAFPNPVGVNITFDFSDLKPKFTFPTSTFQFGSVPGNQQCYQLDTDATSVKLAQQASYHSQLKISIKRDSPRKIQFTQMSLELANNGLTNAGHGFQVATSLNYSSFVGKVLSVTHDQFNPFIIPLNLEFVAPVSAVDIVIYFFSNGDYLCLRNLNLYYLSDCTNTSATPPPNTNFVNAPFSSGSRTQLQCVGYSTLSGTPPVCQNGLTLSSNATCSGAATCPIPTNLPVGIGAGDCRNLTAGQSCTLNCTIPYFAPVTNMTANCVGTGIHTSAVSPVVTPVCQDTRCVSAPANPIGGTFDSCVDSPIGSTCDLTCVGFPKIGSAAICQGDSIWTNVPSCDTRCTTAPPNPTGGYFPSMCVNQTQHTYCELTCNATAGYFLDQSEAGSALALCEGGLQGWTNIPSCTYLGNVTSVINHVDSTAIIIAGASVGAVSIALLVIAVLCFLFRMRKKKAHANRLKLNDNTSSITTNDNTNTISLTVMNNVTISIPPGYANEDAYLASFPTLTTEEQLQNYFLYLQHKDKQTVLRVMDTYLHPMRLNTNSPQFTLLCLPSKLQIWLYPLFFIGDIATATIKSVSSTVESSFFDLVLILIVGVHFRQFSEMAPPAPNAPAMAKYRERDSSSTASSAANRSLLALMSCAELERTLQFMKHNRDWLWGEAPNAFTRFLLFAFTQKLINVWKQAKEDPKAPAWSNLWAYLHVVYVFLFASPINRENGGIHVDISGFMDAQLVNDVMTVIEKSLSACKSMAVEPIPKPLAELMKRLQHELSDLQLVVAYFDTATTYLDNSELEAMTPGSVTAEVQAANQRDMEAAVDQLARSLHKRSSALIASHSYPNSPFLVGGKVVDIAEILQAGTISIQTIRKEKQGQQKFERLINYSHRKLQRDKTSGGTVRGNPGGVSAAGFAGAHSTEEKKSENNFVITAGRHDDEQEQKRSHNKFEELSDKEVTSLKTFLVPSNVIGEGSYGKVYKAMFRGENVAVKVLTVSANGMSSTTAQSSWEQELMLGFQLRSPRIVTFIRVHRELPDVLLVMELMPNGNLRTVMDTMKVDMDTRMQMIVQILRGLTFLHCNDPPVAHRDVKPENVLVASNMEVKLCDFGLASFSEQSGQKSLAGSALYMAPELFHTTNRDGSKANVQVDFLKTDVYSAGILFIELLSNHASVPWVDKTSIQIAELHATHAPRAASLNIQPKGMIPIIQSCLKENPSERPDIENVLTSVLAVDASKTSFAKALSQRFRAFSSHKPSSAARLNGRITLCEECEDAKAVVRCQECQQALCAPCSQALHRSGKRRTHKLVNNV